ncbi:hypothetical protein FOA52_013640 [Chlamydomonas sp. UWO 241]|nr:hypothetical protein FOA52_013640 [Chlamydomonas sp. UWO 241]
MWTTNAFVSEWRAHVKNLLLGIYEPVHGRAIRFAHPAFVGSRTGLLTIINWQVVIVDDDGSRWWGEVHQNCAMPEALVESWGMRDLLAVKKEALPVRQCDLIARLGMVSGTSKTSSKAQEELINAVKQELLASDKTQIVAGEEVKLLEDVGAGAFNKVYRGLWNGTVVAVKSMLLQGGSVSSSFHRERMAIMEAAISKSLSHPNIVQTYTYSIKPLKSGQPVSTGITRKDPDQLGSSNPGYSRQGSGLHNGFEVQLVLEFCDCGTLWDAIAAGCFQADGAGPSTTAVK